ncbi:hypothetical protein [Janthinobacterium sp. B9-8]|uniref:hypothetical protein n=1 Tax=Janthinobacterium sp. B9-8 TaxID=1236179 RepID=UPI00061D0F94|nr:hypothetical protein [Janthinobacterium sp. B9-8]AMC36060.1 hypothetical protein VN23_16380 [Janthinobacterium sp. B9-8]
MTQVELLRHLYVWAYERSTQEYLAIKQNLVEPDPIRLAWRDVIRAAIRGVVRQPDVDAFLVIQQIALEKVAEDSRSGVQALMVEELRRLHEGVLARYGYGFLSLRLGK